MEDFSQSRGDDDLFDDEIVPFEDAPPAQQLTTQLEQVTLEPSSVPPPVETISAAVPAPTTAPLSAKTPVSNDPPLPASRQKPRGGRGGAAPARGGIWKTSGLEDSKWAAKSTDSKQSTAKDTTTLKSSSKQEQAQPSTQADAPPSEATIQPTEEDSTTSPPAAQPPTGPSQNKTPAVRGDRTLTGGAPRSKLTDEELSAKLEAAKERSHNVAAAHARAQADAASFEERERIAGQKRVVEKVERRKMEGERERNRLRKLGGRGGREWDRDKDEQALTGRGDRGYENRSGPAEEDDSRQYEWHDDRGRGRGRGRGGRGARGRGRGGRGGHDGVGWNQKQQHQPDVSAETDFPALPGSAPFPTLAKESSGAKPNKNAADFSKPRPQRWDSGGGSGGNWADQVDSSELDVENTNKPKTSW